MKVIFSPFLAYLLIFTSFISPLGDDKQKQFKTVAVISVDCLHSKSMMASASSWPRPFIYPQKSSEASRLMLRHKQMKERPDTLFAEQQDHSAMNNLLFYTEHSPLWHTAFCQHLTFTKKRGICKGRQILAFEDAEKNDETRFLTLNLYQNGTVMVPVSYTHLTLPTNLVV